MNTDDNNQEVVVDLDNDNTSEDVVTVSRDEYTNLKTGYEKLNQTLGSLKRELKDLKKPKEEPKETKTTEDFGLLHQTFLRAAGIASDDEIELARKIQKETGMDWAKLPDSKYFKSELEELRTTKANAQATSGINGGGGVNDIKSNPEYWIKSGKYPSREEVPDRSLRTKIREAMMKNASTNGKTFYND